MAQSGLRGGITTTAAQNTNGGGGQHQIGVIEATEEDMPACEGRTGGGPTQSPGKKASTVPGCTFASTKTPSPNAPGDGLCANRKGTAAASAATSLVPPAAPTAPALSNCSTWCVMASSSKASPPPPARAAAPACSSHPPRLSALRHRKTASGELLAGRRDSVWWHALGWVSAGGNEDGGGEGHADQQMVHCTSQVRSKIQP